LKSKTLFVLFVVVLVGLVILQIVAPKPVVWQKSYRIDDKSPYGCSLLWQWLQHRYPSRVTRNVERYAEYRKKNKRPDTYILIQHDAFDRSSARRLLSDIEQGTTLILADHDYTTSLPSIDMPSFNWGFDNYLKNIRYSLSYDSAMGDTCSYIGWGYSTNTRDTLFASNIWKRIVDADSEAIMLTRIYGKGRIICGSTPELFTNIVIINPRMAAIAAGLISYGESSRIVWDEHFTIDENSRAPLFVISQFPGLQLGFTITIFASLLYLVVYAKRRQRAIPLLKPKKNTTIDFVKNLGALYWNQRNNYAIATKYIRIWKEHCTVVLRIPRSAAFTAERISVLSSNSVVGVEKLLKAITYVERVDEIGNQELEELHNLLELFYTRKL
jgi:hypothetical protein